MKHLALSQQEPLRQRVQEKLEREQDLVDRVVALERELARRFEALEDARETPTQPFARSPQKSDLNYVERDLRVAQELRDIVSLPASNSDLDFFLFRTRVYTRTQARFKKTFRSTLVHSGLPGCLNCPAPV